MNIIVRAKPSASRNEVEPVSETEFIVRTTAPSTEGKANRAIIELLAKHFGVARSRVSITAGHASRSKMVTIS